MSAVIPPNTPIRYQSNWQHAELASTDQTKLSLDFQDEAAGVDSFTTVDQTINTWLNVSNPAFGPTTKVQAVVIDQNMTLSNPPSPMGQNVNIVDLTYAGDHRFTAPVASLVANVNGVHYGEHHRWQVAAVADGDWKTDPVSGQHNFNIDPTQFQLLTKPF